MRADQSTVVTVFFCILCIEDLPLLRWTLRIWLRLLLCPWHKKAFTLGLVLLRAVGPFCGCIPVIEVLHRFLLHHARLYVQDVSDELAVRSELVKHGRARH